MNPQQFYRVASAAAVAALLLTTSGCAHFSGPDKAPLPLVAYVDLQKYQGPWYIVASIPLSLEAGAHDGVESYALNPDGSIATVFQFRKDGFRGEQKTIVGRSFVQSGSGNAIWAVQAFWPLTGDYRIAYLAPDYSVSIVGQESRDHVWVLSRRPIMDDIELGRYRQQIAAMGYDMSAFQRVPQDGAKP